MSARTQGMIRRDINRLRDIIKAKGANRPALTAIAGIVEKVTEKVNTTWQAFQAAAVAGDKERTERDSSITILGKWIQEWRPVIIMLVPGADQNLQNLPSQGATPDDSTRVAADMKKFIEINAAAASFKDNALAALGTKLEDAKKETSEAVDALTVETAASNYFSEACIEANPVVVRGSQIVRTNFGPTSPEYKQFIARGTKEEEAQLDKDAAVGETK